MQIFWSLIRLRIKGGSGLFRDGIVGSVVNFTTWKLEWVLGDLARISGLIAHIAPEEQKIVQLASMGVMRARMRFL